MKNRGGQFEPELGGHFQPKSGGHFKSELGGQFDRNLHTIKDTGEMITLTHRYEYFNGEETPAKAEMSDTTVDDFMSKNPIATAFSLNGHND